MIEQEKSGKYIAEKRKQLGMTQKDLAERIGLTDKAVSKWERGKSMPDNAILDEVCEALNISFNEYLSGEDIAEEHYADKAEHNMKELMVENNKESKGRKLAVGVMIISVLFIIVGVYGMVLIPGGRIMGFVDIPSFTLLVGLVIILMIVSGYLGDFIQALQILFKKKEYTDLHLGKGISSLKLMIILNVFVGLFLTVSQCIFLLYGLNEKSGVAGMMPLLLLPLWYGLLLDLIWLPCYFRLLRRKD